MTDLLTGLRGSCLSLIHILADAPGQEEALRAFLEFVDGRVLIAHNAHGFDIRFLKACAERYRCV